MNLQAEISAPPAPLGLSFREEIRRRLRERLERNGLDGILLLSPANIAYASGFYFSANERPLGLYVPVSGEPALFVPRLEQENAAGHGIDDIRCYDEFPGPTHPLLWMLDECRCDGLSIDALDARLLPAVRDRLKRLDLRDFTMEQRYVKSPAELALTREAARFADLVLERLHERGADIIAQGGGEAALLEDCVSHARQALLRKHGAAFADTPMGITATVHSGARAALPHGATTDRLPRPGETLIAGIGASLGGYHAESGATFTIGPASKDQLRVMEAMRNCNDAAVAALIAGAPCDSVNEAGLNVLRAAGLGGAIRHRIGHGMGIEGHEAPWLAPGDKTPIAAGMVFSNEPGVYRPGLDGYRTINTMIVTEQGVEIPSRFQQDTPIADRVIAL